MRFFNVKSDEGRALAVLLMTLGPFGRGKIREHLLAQAEDDESRHTLNIMNTFERGYDEMKREFYPAGGVTP